jgi:outer membrane autotransporter protein
MFQRIGLKTQFFSLVGLFFLSTQVLANTSQGAWAQGFLSHLKRDHCVSDNCSPVPIYPGYDLWSSGLAMGVEWQLCPPINGRIGVAVRYDNHDLDGNHLCRENVSLHGQDLDFDSMRAMVYGRWFKKDFFLKGILGYAFNQYFDFQRFEYYPSPFTKRFGDYDGSQWTADFQLGYEWKGPCNIEMTPSAFMYYSHLNTTCHRQMSADDLNHQTVNFIEGVSDDALFAGVDLAIAYVNQYSKAKVIPYIHANVSYQTLKGSLQHFTLMNAFGGGTAYIYPAFLPERNYYEVGGGIKVIGDHNVFVLMSYDYRFQPGEYSHAVLLSIKHDW